MQNVIRYRGGLALVHRETGEITEEGLQIEVSPPKRNTRAFTMMFQKEAAFLASDTRMTEGAFRVMWALLCSMPMRQGVDGPAANVWTGTQDELGELAGITRVSVNRNLKLLEEIGAVSRSKGCVLVAPRIASRGGRLKRAVDVRM